MCLSWILSWVKFTLMENFQTWKLFQVACELEFRKISVLEVEIIWKNILTWTPNYQVCMYTLLLNKLHILWGNNAAVFPFGNRHDSYQLEIFTLGGVMRIEDTSLMIQTPTKELWLVLWKFFQFGKISSKVLKPKTIWWSKCHQRNCG